MRLHFEKETLVHFTWCRVWRQKRFDSRCRFWVLISFPFYNSAYSLLSFNIFNILTRPIVALNIVGHVIMCASDIINPPIIHTFLFFFSFVLTTYVMSCARRVCATPPRPPAIIFGDNKRAFAVNDAHFDFGEKFKRGFIKIIITIVIINIIIRIISYLPSAVKAI